MSSGRRAGKTWTAFREVIVAWVLAGIVLAAVALLPLHEADGPAFSSLAARRIAGIHAVDVMPQRDEHRNALEGCDSDNRDEAPGMPSAQAPATLPLSAPEWSNESNEC